MSLFLTYFLFLFYVIEAVASSFNSEPPWLERGRERLERERADEVLLMMGKG